MNDVRLFLSLRYLKGRSRWPMKPSYGLILGGIVLGLLALLVVSSVMNGFDHYMSGIVTESKGHVWIWGKNHQPFVPTPELLQKIRAVRGVEAAAPVCRTDLVVRKGDRLMTVVAWGIESESFRQVTGLFRHIAVGDSHTQSLQGVLLGIDQSVNLGATVGENIQLMTPIGTMPSPFGLLPRIRQLPVVGVTESGMPDYDKLYIYLPIADARYFLGYGDDQVDLVMVKASSTAAAQRVARRLQSALGPDYTVESWGMFEHNLFSAMRIEKILMFLVLSLVFIIVAFNLAGSFIKLATEKRREIGLLKAIGLTHRDTTGVFLRAGVVVGGLGTLLGLILSGIALWVQYRWHPVHIPIQGFPLANLPVDIRPGDFIAAALLVLGISLGACWIAVRRIARLNPSDALRDER